MENIKINTDDPENKASSCKTSKHSRLRWSNCVIHRDLGYFYLGLIISFSLSGIMLNHRIDWHFDRYTVDTKEVSVDLSQKGDFFSEEKFAENLAKELGVKDKFRRLMVRKGKLSVSYANHNIEIDIKTGKGQITESEKTPFFGQIMQLHRDNSTAWVCYSDIFAISMIIIAITGVLIPKGKKSFRKRGWKFTLAGIVFPIVALLFIM